MSFVTTGFQRVFILKLLMAAYTYSDVFSRSECNTMDNCEQASTEGVYISVIPSAGTTSMLALVKYLTSIHALSRGAAAQRGQVKVHRRGLAMYRVNGYFLMSGPFSPIAQASLVSQDNPRGEERRQELMHEERLSGYHVESRSWGETL